VPKAGAIELDGATLDGTTLDGTILDETTLDGTTLDDGSAEVVGTPPTATQT